MRASELAEFKRMVVESAEHVLPVCGIKARHVDERPPEPPTGGQLAAFIGFSGDLMRGTLTLVAPFSLMRATYPLKLSEDDNWELEIFDWSAEVANRLLGRLKTILATRGVEVDPTPPKVLLADQLQIRRATRGAECMTLNFLAGSAVVSLGCDVMTVDGPDLFTPTAEGDPTPSDGEILLF